VILTVYVPAGPGLPIRDGSGIVGSPVAEGARLRIDNEGNVYASPALRTYATRVFHAAGRHLTRYPTVARAWVAPEALRAVGTWNHHTRHLSLSDEAAVAAWLGRSDGRVPAEELTVIP
jgi:hypothetical protein